MIRRTRQKTPRDEKVLAAEVKNKAIARERRESVVNSSILHSLKASISNGGREREPWKMDLILRILATCPNIKSLEISVSRGGGCVVYDTDDLYAFDFTSNNGTLAPLESLRIDGYWFHANPNGRKWKEWETEHPQHDILYNPWKCLPDSIINFFGYPKIKEWGGLQGTYVKRDTSPLKPGTKTNIGIWMEQMDWKHLRTLSIRNPVTKDLQVFGGNTLPSLRSVEFFGSDAHHHAILDFLGNISTTLESIQFDGIYFCSLTEAMNTIVEHHASSLRTLVIKHSQPRQSPYTSSRNRNSYNYPSTSFLNLTHLTQLRDSIPSLVTLDLDILVGEEWDYELLDTLTSFLELEYLTLRFEAPVGGWDKDSDDEDEDEDELDEDLVYPRYGEAGHREVINKLYLMMGLKEYLKKRKVGKQFKRLETWVGSDVVGDTAVAS